MDQPLALVIEDDEDLALVFTEAITAAGYQVETFYTGDQALKRLGQIVPYLVVLDLHLPGVTGLEILKYIRSDERMKATRVVIASADDHLAEMYRSQVTLVLLKPISMSQLRDLAQRFLQSPSIDPRQLPG